MELAAPLLLGLPDDAVAADAGREAGVRTLVVNWWAYCSDVTLEVFDMLGRIVATLVDEVKSPGRFEVAFEAGELSSGMYIYRMSAGSFAKQRRSVAF